MSVKQEMIDNIIRNYNFEVVHKVMKFLNWRWLDAKQSPSIDELIDKAKTHLNDTYDTSTTEQDTVIISNGGFKVTAMYSYDLLEVFSLELVFSVSSWDVNVIDLAHIDDDDDEF